MKKIILSMVFASVGMLASAQNSFPTIGLKFKMDFNGNFKETASNSVPLRNDANLRNDEGNNTESAAFLSDDSYFTFDNSNMLQGGATDEKLSLRPGRTTGEMTMSIKVKCDGIFMNGFNEGSYSNIFSNDQCFIRLLRDRIIVDGDKSFILQCGILNGTKTFNSFGYIVVEKALFVSDLSTWNDIAMTYKNGKVTIYKNGLEFATKTDLTGNNNLTYSGTELVIGSKPTQQFQGYVDNVFVYDRELTSTEMVQLHSYENTLTSINNFENKESQVIFPNPATDFIIVSEFSEVFDLVGTKVLEGKGKIDISVLANGIYLVKTSKGFAKIVKE